MKSETLIEHLLPKSRAEARADGIMIGGIVSMFLHIGILGNVDLVTAFGSLLVGAFGSHQFNEARNDYIEQEQAL